MLTKWPTRSWQTARGGGIEVLSPLALSAAGRSTASTIQTRVSHARQPMLAFQRRSEDAAASPPTVVSRTLDVAHQARSPPWAMACDGSTLRSSGDHSRAAPRPRCLLEAHISTLEDRAGPCRPICALSFAARSFMPPAGVVAGWAAARRASPHGHTRNEKAVVLNVPGRGRFETSL